MNIIDRETTNKIWTDNSEKLYEAFKSDIIARREKNRSDSFKIFIGCSAAGLIMLAFAIISGLMEVWL